MWRVQIQGCWCIVQNLGEREQRPGVVASDLLPEIEGGHKIDPHSKDGYKDAHSFEDLNRFPERFEPSKRSKIATNGLLT